MDVPKKIRLLNRIGKIFPLWSLSLQARVIEHAFDIDLAEAMKKGDRKEFDALSHAQWFEASEYRDKLRSLRSRRLLARAERMFVPLGDVKWEIGNFGSRYLS